MIPSNGNHPTLDDAQSLLPQAVFIAIENGMKKPARETWQKTTFEQTQKPGYQKHLHYYETHGVVMGAPSNDLVVLDCDSEPFLQRILELGSVLSRSLRVRG